MLEISSARLRSQLAAVLEAASNGEQVVIRRHGTRVAVLLGLGPKARGAASRQALAGPSKLPRVQDTGPVRPVRIRGRLRRSPSEELCRERD